MTQSVLGRLRRFWLDVHPWMEVGLFILWSLSARRAHLKKLRVVPAEQI